MKKKSLQNKSISELNKELGEHREALRTLRFALDTKAKSAVPAATHRKSVARILTELTRQARQNTDAPVV